MKKWKYPLNLACILFLFIQFSFFPITAEETLQIRLSTIPEVDRKSLTAFFKQLVFFEEVGYVLFGSKPMILNEFYSKTLIINPKSCTPSHIFKYNRIFLNYKTWKNYQYLFPIKNYVFRIFEDSKDPSNYLIIFINKKRFIETIERNIVLFKELLGSSITPEYLLNEFERKENFFEDIFEKSLKGHHGLLGILLGYGTYNSLIFQEMDEFKGQLKNKFPPPYDWKTLQNTSNLTSFSSYHRDTLCVDLPRFKEDLSSNESVHIHQNYVETWKYLCELNFNNEFLEITLEALTR